MTSEDDKFADALGSALERSIKRTPVYQIPKPLYSGLVTNAPPTPAPPSPASDMFVELDTLKTRAEVLAKTAAALADRICGSETEGSTEAPTTPIFGSGVIANCRDGIASTAAFLSDLSEALTRMEKTLG